MSISRRWAVAGLVGCMAAALGMARPAAEDRRSAAAINALTEQERSDGWKLLFDGRTTQGWRKYRGANMPARWSASGGALIFDPTMDGDGGDVVTVDMYDNFELAAEWKISPGGNSGIMYRVAETDGEPWRTGPEYQVLDNAKHADGRDPLTSAASCYALYAPSKDVTRPVGEWNQGRVVVNGANVQHWLNGVKVVEYVLGGDDWTRRVKASKFASMPAYGKEPRGHLCLQDHGDRVEYRNLKLRPLTPVGKP